MFTSLLGVFSLFHAAAKPCRVLLWRTRYLFLMVWLMLSWTTPGRYAVEVLGRLSPTLEGLQFSALQSMRSLTVLVALGWALTGLSTRQRMIAFLFALYPLARLKLPVRTLAVRLSLTLSALEEGSGQPQGDWRDAWRQAVAEKYCGQTLDLDLGSWSPLDSVCLGAAFMGVLCALGFNAGV